MYLILPLPDQLHSWLTLLKSCSSHPKLDTDDDDDEKLFTDENELVLDPTNDEEGVLNHNSWLCVSGKSSLVCTELLMIVFSLSPVLHRACSSARSGLITSVSLAEKYSCWNSIFLTHSCSCWHSNTSSDLYAAVSFSLSTSSSWLFCLFSNFLSTFLRETLLLFRMFFFFFKYFKCSFSSFETFLPHSSLLPSRVWLATRCLHNKI